MNKPYKTKSATANEMRVFAISSYMGSAIKSIDKEYMSVNISVLSRRVDNAMKVYNYKKGKEHYWELSKLLENIWSELAEETKSIIDEKYIPILIEFMSYIINDKVHNEFLGLHRVVAEDALWQSVDSDTLRKISFATLRLNDKLNKLLGTKSIYENTRKIKVKKSKAVRDKAKPKIVKEKSMSKAQRLNIQSKQNARKFRDRIKKLKEMNDEQKRKND